MAIARPARSLRRPLALLFSLCLLVACSDGGGGGGGGTTGSVGVLITDGAAEDFSHIWVTVSRIELLGPNGVDLFVGSETFDLLDLENASNPFVIATDVPVGPHEKIRLHLTDLILEKETSSGTEQIRPPLPANGKIDLNPRGTIFVTPGELLLLEIDIDANKSIHVVQTGNASPGYRVRPVVFIRILNDPQDMEKLSRVFGTIDSFIGSDAFVLCAPSVQMSGCLRVNLFPDTTFFDENGAPVLATDLMVGDAVTVPGTLRVVSNDIEIDAIVVEIGDLGTWPRISGVADSAVDVSDRFDLDVDLGEAVPAGITPVQLQPETALVTRAGFTVDRSQIDMDVPVEVDGVPLPDAVAPTEIAAALVIVAPPAFDEMQVSGTIEMLDVPGRMFDLIGASDSWCVDVPAGATILTVSDGGSIASSSAAALSDLSNGLAADVYGEMGASCIQADAVIAYLP